MIDLIMRCTFPREHLCTQSCLSFMSHYGFSVSDHFPIYAQLFGFGQLTLQCRTGRIDRISKLPKVISVRGREGIDKASDVDSFASVRSNGFH